MLEAGIATAFRGQGSVTAAGLRLTTADRSFGAALTGALERGDLRGPVQLELRGAAGQSFGAFAGPGIELRLVGQANDYVGKGLSGGSVTIVPEPDLAATPSSEAIAGNTVLYGATGGRLHLVGRAGMRFAVRNSGAEAVVEGIGAARLRVHDRRRRGRPRAGRRELRRRDDRRAGVPVRPGGRHAAALADGSVSAVRLSAIVSARDDGPARLVELYRLLEAHRAAGSALAARLLVDADLPAAIWVVEPVAVPVEAAAAVTASVPAKALAAIPIERAAPGVSAQLG